MIFIINYTFIKSPLLVMFFDAESIISKLIHAICCEWYILGLCKPPAQTYLNFSMGAYNIIK